MLKRALCTLLLVSALFTVSGCAAFAADSVYWNRAGELALHQDTDMTQTAAERMHTFSRVAETDARGLIEDLDYATLRDRPSRLSQWHVR